MLTERHLSRRREESGSEEAPGRGTNASSLGKGWLGSEAGGRELKGEPGGEGVEHGEGLALTLREAELLQTAAVDSGGV